MAQRTKLFENQDSQAVRLPDEFRRLPLGSRLAARFAGLGLTQQIPELRGQPARPVDYEK